MRIAVLHGWIVKVVAEFMKFRIPRLPKFSLPAQLLLLLGAGAVGLGFGFGLAPGWNRLVVMLFGASLINIGLWGMTWVTERRCVGVKFLSLAHSIQAPILCAICAFFIGPRLRETHPFPVLEANSFATCLGLIAIPLAILIAVMLKAVMTRQPAKSDSLHSILRAADGYFGVILAFAALFYVAFMYSTESLRGPLQYFLRIIFYATSFCSYAAGYLHSRFTKAALAWVIGILAYILYSSITGGRGLAFIFGGLFTLGWVFSFDAFANRVKAAIGVGVPVLLIFLFSSAIIGETRVIIGRGGWDKVKEFDLKTYRDAARQVLDNFAEEKDETSEAGVLGNGIMRLVQWCNITVPAMSPQGVPFRGFGDLDDEIRSLFRLGIVSGRAYWANLLSNKYDFYTAEDGSSAIEFGLISDSWSRGGFPAALLYGICTAFFFMAIETVVVITFRNWLALKALLVLVIVNQAIFTFVRESVLTCSRLLILYLGITVIVFGLVQLLYDRLKRPRLRPAAERTA